MSRLTESIAEAAKTTEAKLLELLGERPEEGGAVWDAMKYSLMAGGKRIRPYLVLETCRALGGNTERQQEEALIYASALEMIHTYSLIHDDLPCMDDDTLRRGKPCCHIVYGEATAMLAGDALLTLAFEAVAAQSTVLPKRAIKAVEILASASGMRGMIGGQQTDLEGEGKTITYEQMVSMHEKKTCALIIAACKLGALAAGETHADVTEAVEAYGMGIGRAFQLVDDILDRTASSEQLGKDAGSDLKKDKTTYLTFLEPEVALQLAYTITDKAKEAIAPYDANGLLTELADSLIERKK